MLLNMSAYVESYQTKIKCFVPEATYFHDKEMLRVDSCLFRSNIY